MSMRMRFSNRVWAVLLLVVAVVALAAPAGAVDPVGQVTEFSVGISPLAVPRGITAGPDGNLWFTEATGNRIGRIGPGACLVTPTFAFPDGFPTITTTPSAEVASPVAATPITVVPRFTG